MDSISSVGAKGVNNVQNASKAADSRRSLFDAASSIFESENGERNANATGRFAAARSSRQDGLGGAIDVSA